MKIMKRILITIFILDVIGLSIGVLGMFTEAGIEIFKETDGNLPCFILVSSLIVLGILAFAFYIGHLFGSKKSKEDN